jgi:hypothetical protein
MAGELVVSFFVLLYTAAVVPVQIFMWDYSDQCNQFPTLKFDVAVDSFFMVPRIIIIMLASMPTVLRS